MTVNRSGTTQMAKQSANKTFILLLAKEESVHRPVGSWLKENGFIAWKANDVAHAIEELSDFTVQNRPHVVLLEVPFLSRSFQAVRSALRSCAGEPDMTVLAFDRQSDVLDDNQFFASDIGQLSSLINREV